MFAYTVGLILMPCGVVLTIRSGLGSGGSDALNFAIAKTLHINPSIAIYLIGSLLVAVTALIRKRAPKVATLIALAVIGGGTDLWNLGLNRLSVEGIGGRFLLLFAGNLIIAFSVGIYMASGFPTNPQDDFVKALVERGWKIRAAKILFDGCCVFFAFLLKGEIGPGTLIGILFLGPMVDFFHTVANRFYLQAGAENDGVPRQCAEKIVKAWRWKG